MAVTLAIVLALTVLNGLFAMSEMAMVTARKARLQAAADAGSRRARLALRLAADPGRMLSTVQIGITLLGVASGAISGAGLSEPLERWLATYPALTEAAPAIAFGIVIVGVTFVSLVIGELVPKRLALRRPEALAAAMAPMMAVIQRIASPFVWLLERASRALLFLLGARNETQQTVSEEELKLLMAEGTEAGVFHPEEQEIVGRAIRLGDRGARSIMTPRPDVLWLDLNEPSATLIEKARQLGHSRYPAAYGKLDEVQGVIHVRDLIALPGGTAPDLATLVQKVPIVYDTLPVVRVLDVLRQSRTRMALVFDEYGTFEGVVTPTDILEAMVGAMPDNSPENDEPSLTRREDGSLLADGSWTLEDVKLTLGFNAIPGEDVVTTLGGFILHRLGRVPKEADSVTFGGYIFEVVDMDGRRVDKILVREVQPAGGAPAED